MRDHPDACEGLDSETQVPAHETSCHHHPAVHPWQAADQVSDRVRLLPNLDLMTWLVNDSLLGAFSFLLQLISDTSVFVQLTSRCDHVSRRMVTAAALKQAWAAMVIQRHCRGYLVRRLYQLVQVATVTIQAYTRGWIARKRYKKVSYQISNLNVLRNHFSLTF